MIAELNFEDVMARTEKICGPDYLFTDIPTYYRNEELGKIMVEETPQRRRGKKREEKKKKKS
jgi:hypothetical protein